MQRQPVLGVAHRLVPGEVLPEVDLLLGVTGALGEAREKLLRQLGDLRVEEREVDPVVPFAALGVPDLLGSGVFDPLLAAPHRRHHPVDQAPVERLRRRNRLVEEENLARPLVADRDRQPLRRAAAGDRADVGADLLDEGVLRHDRQVAGELRFVAAADRHAVQTGDDRLAGVQDALDVGAEERHVLPVVARGGDVVLGVLLDVAAGAEGLVAGAGEDDHPDRVVEARVAKGGRELFQGACTVGVVILRPLDGDGGDEVALRVEHFLETEAGGGTRGELAHGMPPPRYYTNYTVVCKVIYKGGGREAA